MNQTTIFKWHLSIGEYKRPMHVVACMQAALYIASYLTPCTLLYIYMMMKWL